MWGPWTSKTNGDHSMLRLEADPPCGFCMYGEKARGGGVKLGEGLRDIRGEKIQKGRAEERKVRWM